MAEILYFPRKTIYGTPEGRQMPADRSHSTALIIPFPGISDTTSIQGDENPARGGPCWTLDGRTKDSTKKSR